MSYLVVLQIPQLNGILRLSCNSYSQILPMRELCDRCRCRLKQPVIFIIANIPQLDQDTSRTWILIFWVCPGNCPNWRSIFIYPIHWCNSHDDHSRWTQNQNPQFEALFPFNIPDYCTARWQPLTRICFPLGLKQAVSPGPESDKFLHSNGPEIQWPVPELQMYISLNDKMEAKVFSSDNKTV